MSFNPFLVDNFALNTTNNSIEEIAIQITEAVLPDIFYNIMRLRTAEKIREQAISIMVPDSALTSIQLNTIKQQGKLKHDKLPKTMFNCILIIRKIFYDVDPISLEDPFFNFSHDTNPDRELIIWEAVVATYAVYFW